MPTPPRNPYIAGKALNDAHGFFGREDVFRLSKYDKRPDRFSKTCQVSFLLQVISQFP